MSPPPSSPRKSDPTVDQAALSPDSYPGHEDLAWIRAVQGDDVSRETFVERMVCVPRFLAARNARAGGVLDRETLADLAQEVALLVWSKLDEFEGRARFETWVYRFCHLLFLKALERKGLRAAREKGLDQLPEPDHPEATSVRSEAQGLGQLERLLERLSEREAQVIRRTYVEGLSMPEVAKELGISTSSVKTHYYRGLEKLRQATPQEDS